MEKLIGLTERSWSTDKRESSRYIICIRKEVLLMDSSSILESIKKLLGIAEHDDGFDSEIKDLINAGYLKSDNSSSSCTSNCILKIKYLKGNLQQV